MIASANVGRMDLQVIIETPTETNDSETNEPTSSWATFATVWAERLRNTVSDETFEADQQVAKKKYKLRIRWMSGITEKMRVNIGGEYNYISNVEEWGRKSYLILTTEKRDNV
jgi:SPP1 family predicted phage head-tail adaptor